MVSTRITSRPRLTATFPVLINCLFTFGYMNSHNSRCFPNASAMFTRTRTAPKCQTTKGYFCLCFYNLYLSFQIKHFAFAGFLFDLSSACFFSCHKFHTHVNLLAGGLWAVCEGVAPDNVSVFGFELFPITRNFCCLKNHLHAQSPYLFKYRLAH